MAKIFLNNVLSERQKMRIETLLNPNSDPLGAGWNITQSKIAIGSGGLSGKGFFRVLRQDLILFQSKVQILFFSHREEFGFLVLFFL